ncbi:MAG: hypothetical protein E7035_07845 [Verrucomicrobiaceae bacterium]|jgi:hypothetical protein|nr:hypothetical protein [Verrucomicrobiaceae bacterium]
MNNQDNNKCPDEFKLAKEDVEFLKEIKNAYQATEKEINSLLADRIKHKIDCDIKKLHQQNSEKTSV